MGQHHSFVLHLCSILNLDFDVFETTTMIVMTTAVAVAAVVVVVH